MVPTFRLRKQMTFNRFFFFLSIYQTAHALKSPNYLPFKLFFQTSPPGTHYLLAMTFQILDVINRFHIK